MALNYQRVGWEDAPSTNTPLDAANLNHMDNGIVALSNEFDRVIPGLEEIAETVSPLLPNMSTMTQDISTLQGQTSALATQAQHILGNFATVEEGETASSNYSTGQHVVLGDYLYKVTADIAQGESFVENTNIEKTTVGSEIDELNSKTEGFSVYSTLSKSDTSRAEISAISGVVYVNQKLHMCFAEFEFTSSELGGDFWLIDLNSGKFPRPKRNMYGTVFCPTKGDARHCRVQDNCTGIVVDAVPGGECRGYISYVY